MYSYFFRYATVQFSHSPGQWPCSNTHGRCLNKQQGSKLGELVYYHGETAFSSALVCARCLTMMLNKELGKECVTLKGSWSVFWKFFTNCINETLALHTIMYLAAFRHLRRFTAIKTWFRFHYAHSPQPCSWRHVSRHHRLRGPGSLGCHRKTNPAPALLPYGAPHRFQILP